jgi:nucleoside-diphosphate-sugar epimerase
METDKKILVLGGAGYIGGLTVDTLISKGFNVTVYDNLLYEERYLKPVKFINGDIRETDKVIAASQDCDVVVILAALVGDPACAVNPKLTQEINTDPVRDICKKLPKSKSVIFMSTCSVYGAQDEMLDENSKTNPLSAYAATKLESEKFVLDRGGLVFRLGTVFGLGDTYSRLRMDLVVNVLTMRAMKYGEININGGDQWRPIIAVKDIARYISEACQVQRDGIYILSKENVIIRELGEKVASLVPDTKINYTEISFQDSRNYKVDNSKSLNTFQYEPKISVEQEVSRMLNIFSEGRVKDPEDKVYHNGSYLSYIQDSK